MKNILGPISRKMMIAAVATLLLSPVMVTKEALATLPDCQTNDPVNCTTPYYSTNCNPVFGATVICTPEMSDYLAAAFVIVASGMIYYFRRRAQAGA